MKVAMLLVGLALFLGGVAVGFLLRPAPSGWVPVFNPGIESAWQYAAYVPYNNTDIDSVAAWYAKALDAEADISTDCDTGDTCFTVVGSVDGRTVQVQGSGFAPLSTVLVSIGTTGE